MTRNLKRISQGSLVLCLVFAVTGQPASAQPKAMDATQAWAAVIKDGLSPGPFREFLAKYPQAPQIENKKIYLRLEEKIANFQETGTKPTFEIPFETLPANWSRWKRDYPYLSVISIDSDGGMSLPSGFSGRFDNNGNYTLPTLNGSLFVFEPKTANAKWSAVGRVLFNGITIEAKGKNTLYFGMIEGHGLVHLLGSGRVTMPNGNIIELPDDEAK